MYIGLIPARAGSKGIKNKNILNLAGKPLISWSFESALDVPSLNRIVCTSDCTKVQSLATQYGIEVIDRPAFLAQDNTHIIDVIKHALSTILFANATHIVLLQPTSPFRKSVTVENCIKISRSTSSDTVITAYENKHMHPSLIFSDFEDTMSPNWLLSGELMKRRQEYSRYLIRCGVCYVTKVDTIIEASTIYGKLTKYCEVSAMEALNIDHPEDLALANFYIKNAQIN